MCEDERSDDAIPRLASTDRWCGFGVLADEPGGTREGMRRIRQEMRKGFDDDIEQSGDA